MKRVTTLRIPTENTLKKYGLSLDDWWVLHNEQKGRCAICGRVPDCGFLCIDHEHVRGYKRLTKEEKKEHVRGLCCPHCNHRFVNRWITLEMIALVIPYLEAYSKRKSAHVKDSTVAVEKSR